MRITGGLWRSRALKAPRGMATRPTADRVREALFSMLVADGHFDPATPARVLDLYSGSGALAFEALSRSAAQAVAVEHGRDALAVIRDNARTLGAEGNITIVAAKVERVISTMEGPFDVIFVDPPYAEVTTPELVGVLERAGRLLAVRGTLVLEHARSDEPPVVAGLVLDRSRNYGDTSISLYEQA